MVDHGQGKEHRSSQEQDTRKRQIKSRTRQEKIKSWTRQENEHFIVIILYLTTRCSTKSTNGRIFGFLYNP